MLVARLPGYRKPPVVLKYGRLILFSRGLRTSRCIAQQNNPSSQDGNRKLDSKSSMIGKSWLEPRWDNIKSKLDDTRKVINKVATQLQFHFGKARDAIRDANRKIAEQERDRSNQRLNYDKDVENDGKIRGLPSEREIYRRKWARKLEFYLDSLQETIFTATRALNDVTGYSSIQKLRKSIELMEGALETTRSDLKVIKEEYERATEERTRSQRELNELLQRKNSWTPEELDRFTQLYKNDASNLKNERELKDEVSKVEARQENLSNDLYRAILTRYHEEQIWSDKIRRTSTWGTCLLMVVNILLFLVFQLLLEPWKRRRLTNSFEDKVKAALDQHAGEQNMVLKDLSASVNEQNAKQQTDIVMPTDIAPPPEEPPKEPPKTELVLEEILPARMDDVYEKIRHFYLVTKMRTAHIWRWIKTTVTQLDASDALNLHSEKTFTNWQIYAYSIFLLLCGSTISYVI